MIKNNSEQVSYNTLHYTTKLAMEMINRGEDDIPETCEALLLRLQSLGKKNKTVHDEKLAQSLWQLAMKVYIRHDCPAMVYQLMLASRTFTANPLLLRRISNDLDKIQHEYAS